MTSTSLDVLNLTAEYRAPTAQIDMQCALIKPRRRPLLALCMLRQWQRTENWTTYSGKNSSWIMGQRKSGQGLFILFREQSWRPCWCDPQTIGCRATKGSFACFNAFCGVTPQAQKSGTSPSWDTLVFKVDSKTEKRKCFLILASFFHLHRLCLSVNFNLLNYTAPEIVLFLKAKSPISSQIKLTGSDRFLEQWPSWAVMSWIVWRPFFVLSDCHCHLLEIHHTNPCTGLHTLSTRIEPCEFALQIQNP